MLKWIAPIAERLRHIQQPRLFAVTGHTEPNPDHPTLGQQMAERVAAFVGSWVFLGGQATFLVLWLIYNTIQITQFTKHFDPYPYILLNLLLSFQAAFTGPVLLIAANVGAIRDHAQANRIEKLTTQNEQLAEQNEKLVEQMCNLEEMVDKHITDSAQAHSAEIAELAVLVRAIHATVTTQHMTNSAVPSIVAADTNNTTAPAQPEQPLPSTTTGAINTATSTNGTNARTSQPKPRRRR